MFGKKKDPFAQGGHTLFANALEIIGDVRFGGTLDIEGTVRGNVFAEPSSSDALVNVHACGHVVGEIHAPKVIINGHVTGNVFCSKHLELAANAVVTGDVHYKVIEMVKGAQVNGKLVFLEESADEITQELQQEPLMEVVESKK